MVSRHSTIRRKPWLTTSRRGAITVLAAAMSVFLCVMVAFAVDVGYVYWTRSDLESAANAAAMAGGIELRNDEAFSDIRNSAVTFAELNSPGISNILRTSDVTLGIWNFDTKVFTAGGTDPNAVRVTIRRDHLSAKVPTFFSKVFGVASIDDTVTAITAFDPEWYDGTEIGPIELVQ